MGKHLDPYDHAMSLILSMQMQSYEFKTVWYKDVFVPQKCVAACAGCHGKFCNNREHEYEHEHAARNRIINIFWEIVTKIKFKLREVLKLGVCLFQMLIILNIKLSNCQKYSLSH